MKTDLTLITPSLERYYTINELAKSWNLSYSRVWELIRHEPGVLRFGRQAPGRRTRTLYRVPEAVVERILRRCANPAA
jgi:hypothetical protein